ncbi:MAG TPA: potassium uptake protein, TrkH family, partial [Candidatus Galloscillospira excrementavium]|nr:potassium uptake protein, TrkH family [Candidatus Galloscillospira excrementavium]
IISYNDDPVVLLVTGALIVIGGLGFFVWEDIWVHRSWKKFSLYTKMVLTMTAMLLVVGGLFFFIVEHDNPATLGDMPFWQKGLNSLFQSITLRTAGFDSIGQGGLQDSSKALSVILMLVGGSSGSTAGGVKTGTVAVLLLAFRASLAGREQVTIRGRSISYRRVMDAMTLVLMVVFLFLASSMVISTIEPFSYLDTAYEVASAMGTVGVTTGITPSLTAFSQSILIALMYLGRVGIMSFSVAFLVNRQKNAKIKYPTVDIMIG